MHVEQPGDRTNHGVAFATLGRTFASPDRSDRDSGPGHVVLRDMSLDIAEGEVVAVLGSSGYGKSTLLRLAAGLDRPSAGEVRLGGEPVGGIDPRCAVVLQEP